VTDWNDPTTWFPIEKPEDIKDSEMNVISTPEIIPGMT